jgi:ATP-dependent RNA helicase DOB1
MYNSITESIIAQTPDIIGIDTEQLPKYLTKVYTKIVSIRKKLRKGKIPKSIKRDVIELRKLANNLETLTILHRAHPHHISAAFVAGTAHQLLQLIHLDKNSQNPVSIDRESISSSISAIMLFLIAESPADAAEVSKRINPTTSDIRKNQLISAIQFLAEGQMGKLRSQETIQKSFTEDQLEQEAEDYLWSLLLKGLQQIAEELLGIGNSYRDYFGEVIRLSSFVISNEDEEFIETNYSGPLHLAKLLDILGEKLLSKGIINVPNPVLVDQQEWHKFLRRLAAQRPYLWQNHYEAIQTGFLNRGRSAVLAFPTGAGKTTLSELKIASTLMSGGSILYLVPTHALEDQVNRDLKKIFEDITEDILEIGSEFTMFEDESLSSINVMTPERCLTLLSTDNEGFEDIELVVFDEFHLINGREDKLDKRSLDAMFCLLSLFEEIPDADYLMISAMIENSEEIAAWIAKITSRPCEVFNSSWKPTRQLQGCLVFPQEEIIGLHEKINKGYNDKTTKTPPKSLNDQMKATAYQLFSLQNRWNENNQQDFLLRKLFKEKINLSIGSSWGLTSNRNKVAGDLASFFISQGIKTLIFVDNPVFAKSTAKYLEGILPERSFTENSFENQNKRGIEALSLELGSSKYSFFDPSKQVASHHGLLLPIERQLNEARFKSNDGIHCIVATATLAQGINLPAEVVIIAGDDRFDEDTEARESLQAHEILNAAGRAGRAGSSAQGVVLIVPGDIITFSDKKTAPLEWIKLQENIFSKTDQCLTINDPLNHFLDVISATDDEKYYPDNVRNLLFKLDKGKTEDNKIRAIMNKSLAAYRAANTAEQTFAQKVEALIQRREGLAIDLLYHERVEKVSLKTGLDPAFVQQIDNSLDATTVETLLDYELNEWISWFFDWLNENPSRVNGIFSSKGAQTQLARVLGLKVTNFAVEEIALKIKQIEPILLAYVGGENYEKINILIEDKKEAFLSKARHFILRLVPQFSFAFGVIALTMREKLLDSGYNNEEIPNIIKQMATMIREGLDTDEKLRYKLSHRSYLRVQIHREFI